MDAEPAFPLATDKRRSEAREPAGKTGGLNGYTHLQVMRCAVFYVFAKRPKRYCGGETGFLFEDRRIHAC